MIDWIHARFSVIANLFYWVAMITMMVMSLHIFASISMRLLTGRELAGTLEITAYYYMPILAFAALPYLDRFGGHISADLLGGLFGEKGGRYLEAVTRLGMAVFFFLLAWYSIDVAVKRTLSGEVARSADGYLLVWPGRWVLALAVALACIQSLIAIPRVLRGDKIVTQFEESDAGAVK